jgi:hypothetical protein
LEYRIEVGVQHPLNKSLGLDLKLGIEMKVLWFDDCGIFNSSFSDSHRSITSLGSSEHLRFFGESKEVSVFPAADCANGFGFIYIESIRYGS